MKAESPNESATQPRRTGARSAWRAMGGVFAVDLRTLAVMRIGIGLLILTDLLLRARDLTAHYCDDGVLPVRALARVFPTGRAVCLHAYFHSPWGVGALFAFQAVLAVLLTIGYRTRLVTVLSWLLMVSLQWRNPVICDGGDHYLVLILFWGLLLPWHARFSVDAALTTTPPPRSNRFVSPASAGLMMQLALVYLITAAVKIQSPMWQDGSAVSVALHYEGAVSRLGRMLLDWPQAMHVISYLVIAFEFTAPLLMFSPVANGPVRAVTLILLIVMHSVFGLCMKLGIFPLIAIAGLIGVMPTWLVDRVAGRFRKRALTVYYDGDCGFCRKSVLLLKSLPGLSGATIRPAQDEPDMLADMRDNNSWIVVGDDGVRYRRHQALVMLLRASPLGGMLAWFLALKPVAGMGERVYRWIADHRAIMSKALAWMRFRPIRFDRRMNHTTAVVLMAFTLYCGWYGVVHAHDPQPVDPLGVRLAMVARLNQRWNMYSQKKLHTGWLVASGLFNDGTTTELIRGRTPVSWAKPPLISATYANIRRQMWIESMAIEAYTQLRTPYLLYLRRRWDARYAGARHLIRIELFFMLNRVFGEDQADLPDRMLLASWRRGRAHGPHRVGRSR